MFPAQMGLLFHPTTPALSAATISKAAVKPAAPPSTNSSSVAISSTKNVTEYHAVALVSTRRVALDPADGLPGQAGLFGDPNNAHGLNDHRAYLGRKRSYTGDQLNKVRAMLGQQRGGTSIAAPISPLATFGSPIHPRHPIGPRREGARERCLNHRVGPTTQRPSGSA